MMRTVDAAEAACAAILRRFAVLCDEKRKSLILVYARSREQKINYQCNFNMAISKMCGEI